MISIYNFSGGCIIPILKNSVTMVFSKHATYTFRNNSLVYVISTSFKVVHFHIIVEELLNRYSTYTKVLVYVVNILPNRLNFVI